MDKKEFTRPIKPSYEEMYTAFYECENCKFLFLFQKAGMKKALKIAQAYDGKWFPVRPKGYFIECCDCGLRHKTEFRLVRRDEDGWQLEMRVWRQPKPKNLTSVPTKNIGQQGGRARAEKLSPERRQEIARQAALARWRKVTANTLHVAAAEASIKAAENKTTSHFAYITPSVLTWALNRAAHLKFPRERVAFELGITSGRLSMWEQELGKRPTMDQIDRLAKLLDVPFGIFWLPKPPPEKRGKRL